MCWVYFEESAEVHVFDGSGSAPHPSKGVELFGGMPDPHASALFGLLDEPGSVPELSEWAELFGGIPEPDSSAFLGLCRFCRDNAAVVNAALPWLAAEVGHNDGYRTMLKFIRRWGGARLYVPKDHGRFVAKVGCRLGPSTHQRCMREASAASQIEVPSAWGVFMALRRVAIVIAVRARLPPEEIARRFGVTMRSLR